MKAEAVLALAMAGALSVPAAARDHPGAFHRIENLRTIDLAFGVYPLTRASGGPGTLDQFRQLESSSSSLRSQDAELCFYKWNALPLPKDYAGPEGKCP